MVINIMKIDILKKEHYFNTNFINKQEVNLENIILFLDDLLDDFPNEPFYIKDNGIGIPDDKVNNIFDRFYRVNKDRNKTTGGSGLGLSIVKTIVEAHNGEIKIDSKIDIGTTIIVEFNEIPEL